MWPRLRWLFAPHSEHSNSATELENRFINLVVFITSSFRKKNYRNNSKLMTAVSMIIIVFTRGAEGLLFVFPDMIPWTYRMLNVSAFI